MKPASMLLLVLFATPAAQAQTVAWRCESKGRVVYQQEPCGGRLVGARDRRTEAQKRAERDAQKREREKASQAVAEQQAEAASAPASGVSPARKGPTLPQPRP
jgi:hypothetical protein